jgi:hypothetical protein
MYVSRQIETLFQCDEVIRFMEDEGHEFETVEDQGDLFVVSGDLTMGEASEAAFLLGEALKKL